MPASTSYHRSRGAFLGLGSPCHFPDLSLKNVLDHATNVLVLVLFILDLVKVVVSSRVGLLVDSEIVLSTRYGKTMVFINQTLSTETVYQQDLINRDLLSTRLIVGKVGPGMWCGKCNSTSNVLVCE